MISTGVGRPRGCGPPRPREGGSSHRACRRRQAPLKGLFAAVDEEALLIGAGRLEQRAGRLGGKAFSKRKCAVSIGKGLPYCRVSSGRIVPEPRQETAVMRLPERPTSGAIAWVPYQKGGRPAQ